MNSLGHVTSKLGNVDPATRSIAAELYSASKAAGHEIWFMWGMGEGKEHGSGNALDLMIRNEAGGDFVRNYIWANRARLRLRHVIWEQHITSTLVKPGVRRKMPDRGNATENHYDHVHVWFFDGAYVAPPSGAGAQAATGLMAPSPKPTAGKRTLYWNKKKQLHGADVKALQTGLRRVFPSYAGGLEPDGFFGPSTHRAVCEFQHRTGLEKDGRVGPATRAKLKKHGIRI